MQGQPFGGASSASSGQPGSPLAGSSTSAGERPPQPPEFPGPTGQPPGGAGGGEGDGAGNRWVPALIGIAAVVFVIAMIVVMAVRPGTPGAGPTAAPSQPTPSVSPTMTAVSAVTEAHLLTAPLLESTEFSPVGWRQLAAPATAWTCAPAGGESGSLTTLRRSFVTVDQARLDQVVTVFPDADSAARGLATLWDRVINCPAAQGGKLDAGWRLDQVGDQAFLAEYVVADPDPDNDLVVQVRLARTGVAVTSVVTGGLQNEWGHGPVDFRKLAVAVERLCGAAEGTCVDSPQRVRILPKVADVTGFLRLSDMPEIPGNEWVASEVMDTPERPDVETVCDVGLLASVGPLKEQERHFTGIVGDDPLAVSVIEEVANFRDAAATAAYVQKHAQAYGNCPGAEQAPRRLAIAVPGSSVSAWSMDFIHAFIAAVQVRDRVAVLLTGSTGTEISEAEFRHLVESAAERLH